MRFVRLLVLISAMGVTGCAGPVSQMVLAHVNDEPVTVQQLEDTFTSTHQGHGVFLAGNGAVREFLDKVIDRRLLLQEARRVRADQNAEIANLGEEVRAKRAGDAFFAEQLKTVKVSDDEVKGAWERLDARINARHILVDTREEAERALARVKAGEDFGDVAAQVSTALTASRGGDIGIVRWGQLTPDVEDRLWALDKGDVSEPFQTEEGWNLLFVIDRTTIERPKLEQAEKLIRARLEERARRRRSEALFRDLRQRWKAVVNEEPVVKALAGEGASSDPTEVVVEAGGERITLEQALKLVNVEAARKLRPGRQRLEVRWLLQGELSRILLRKEALARGYGKRREIVDGVAKIVDGVVLDQFLDRVVLSNVQVADAEVEEYYRAHANEFTAPEAVKLAATMVETEKQAQAVVDEASGGKDFGAIVRATSKDPRLIPSSGELGWTLRGRLDPEVEKVAFSLAPGSVGIAKGRAGYFVVRVDKRREAQVRPFAEVKEEAKQRALRQKSQETLKAWVTKLREASVVEIDENAIARAVVAFEEEVSKKAQKR